MNGQSTLLTNPENPKAEPRKFTYDYSLWSHDGYKTRPDGYCEPAAAKYVDQEQVFQKLGRQMLDNAWKGYNCSIFAYGQTGSGKSYSIIGHGANKGLVPRTCETLFTEMEQNQKPGIQYAVTFSMLEIYNEQVRDLLNKKTTPTGGLKVKERPNKGFYVEGLTVVPVGSYTDIRLRMSEGDRQRTIASTKMNETSSRAHTIVALTFAQNYIKEKVTKQSLVNLVDLAGSERAKQTEATGDRFEEAKNINLSLMTLGSVIKGLCDKAKGAKSAHIPYRDAVLTKLLKNALGGNSKTIMVAAISPDAENYDQTLSTLKYADRAKAIRTTAHVNQEATDKLIKDLIAEKERLLEQLKNAKQSTQTGYTEEDLQKLKEEQEEEIRRYKEQMGDSERYWQKRLEEARSEMQGMLEKEQKGKEEERRIPHLSNLNEDPALLGAIKHLIKEGSSSIGNGKDGSSPDIILNGPRIAREHAVITNKKGQVFLRPNQGLVLHNGRELTKEIQLSHQDRVRFGSNNLFVFLHPGEAEKLQKKGKKLIDITFDYAQSEIAKNSGLNIAQEDGVLQEEVLSIMQVVQDVNAMASELEKPVEFNIVLVSPEARGLESGRTEVYVQVHDLETENEYLWERNRFLNRQCHMQEMYRKFEEEGDYGDVPKEKDPFWEPPDTDVIVGVASVPLNYLSYMIEFKDEPLTIIDYRAKQIGFLRVDLLPCDSKGNDDVDLCVEDPIDLVGRQMAFKLQIQQAWNLPERFVKTWCRFRFYNDNEYIKSKTATGATPKYDFEKLYKFGRDNVTHKFVDYLRDSSLAIEVWGHQKAGLNASGSTGTLRKRGVLTQEEKQKLLNDVAAWKDKAEKYEAALRKVKDAVTKGSKSSTTEKIQKIIHEAGV